MKKLVIVFFLVSIHYALDAGLNFDLRNADGTLKKRCLLVPLVIVPAITIAKPLSGNLHRHLERRMSLLKAELIGIPLSYLGYNYWQILKNFQTLSDSQEQQACRLCHNTKYAACFACLGTAAAGGYGCSKYLLPQLQCIGKAGVSLSNSKNFKKCFGMAVGAQALFWPALIAYNCGLVDRPS
jgi:hypothetical protein